MPAVRGSVVALGPNSLTLDLVRSILTLHRLHLVDVTRPDLPVVIVLVEPAEADWRVAQRIGAPVVLVAEVVTDGEFVEAVDRGARAVLCTDVAARRLADAVVTVLGGGAALDEHQAALALDALRRRRAAVEPLRLTPREQAIIRSIDRGESIKQTARSLGIASKTVENLQGRLFRKLGVRNRAQAIAAAHRAGLVGADAGEPRPDSVPSA